MSLIRGKLTHSSVMFNNVGGGSIKVNLRFNLPKYTYTLIQFNTPSNILYLYKM